MPDSYAYNVRVTVFNGRQKTVNGITLHGAVRRAVRFMTGAKYANHSRFRVGGGEIWMAKTKKSPKMIIGSYTLLPRPKGK